MTAEYKLTDTDEVIRTVDGMAIPNSYTQPRVDYEEWLSNGGIPDPAAPFPPAAGDLTGRDLVLFKHENRLRSIEGEPAIGPAEFKLMLGE
jgi:hypothetical protein